MDSRERMILVDEDVTVILTLISEPASRSLSMYSPRDSHELVQGHVLHALSKCWPRGYHESFLEPFFGNFRCAGNEVNMNLFLGAGTDDR